MRYLMCAGFLVHAVAHFVGFVVPWRLVELEEAPYKTSQLAGTLDVGDLGMRIVGILWLLGALAFTLAGIGVLLGAPWWPTLAVYAGLFSLILSVFGWPESRYGVFINIALVVFLLIGGSRGWLPPVPG